MTIIDRAKAAGVVTMPKWLSSNTAYLTVMGSVAYGASSDSSDVDVYGFCVPPKEDVFPHLAGRVSGFDWPEQFQQWQHHGAVIGAATYDFSVFGVVKYAKLCLECNPNMIDSLFTPRRCVLHVTAAGAVLRDGRRSFLHRGAYHKFKGYAYAQMKKLRDRVGHENPKRDASIREHGYDVKYAMHLVRLLDECRQILVEGDLDLERNSEQLKSIRRGEWTLDRVEKFFEEQEVGLQAAYDNSALRSTPDAVRAKALLLGCLEAHYGSLDQAAVATDLTTRSVIDAIDAALQPFRR